MDLRRKWNAFVGWCLYYPLGGVSKIRARAYEWLYVRGSLKGAFYMHTYHEYLVRNATKALTRQVEELRRKDKNKD